MNSCFVVLLCAFIAVAHCSPRKLPVKKNSPSNFNSKRVGIYNGSNTTIEEHPYLGVLLWSHTYFACEVSIISRQWVITTADCVTRYLQSKLSVLVGSNDARFGDLFDIHTILVHPKYNNLLDYNYACIRIIGKFMWSDKVKPVDLPNKPAAPNTNMVVAGWGLTSFKDSRDSSSYNLLQGNMTWLAKDKCKFTFSSYGFTWTDRLGCAYSKGKTTLCIGDWGDAFVNAGVLYGMFITGLYEGFCSSFAKPVILADVSSILDWVAEITADRHHKHLCL